MSWSGGGQLYGRERFDPVQVCARIAAMQAVFYGAFAVSAFVLASLAGVPWGAASLLQAGAGFSAATALGWCNLVALFCAALAAAAALPFVALRARKSLDFAFTVYFVHLVLTAAGEGAFPAGAAWWLAHVAAFILTAALGEQLCLRREMQDISVEDILSWRRRTAGAGGGGGGSSSGGSSGGSSEGNSGTSAGAGVGHLGGTGGAADKAADGGGGDLLGVLTQEANDNTSDIISESYGWRLPATTATAPSSSWTTSCAAA